MQSENLACEWNDVALLTDQRACTFLCKAMLCLSSPADGLVEGIQLKSWKGVSEPECQDELAGSVQLEVLYRDSKGESFIYSVELWLRGTIAEPVPFTGEACLLYSRGKAAGQHLLLELVIQLPRALQLQSTQVIAGQFAMIERLELPETWPACSSVLTTAVTAEVQACTVDQQMLQVEGRYRFTAVYVNDSQPGECLFAWQQYRPFLWKNPVPEGLREITGAVPYYQSLSVEVLDEHRIQLNGNGVICTLPVEDEQSVLLENKPFDYNEKTYSEEQDAIPMDVQPQSPSVINSRGSRRANLSRYMRNLSGMGQSPTTIRNYGIGENETEQE